MQFFIHSPADLIRLVPGRGAIPNKISTLHPAYLDFYFYFSRCPFSQSSFTFLLCEMVKNRVLKIIYALFCTVQMQ